MASDLAIALSDVHSLVIAWLGRGTLHLVGRDDYPWLLGLTASGRLASGRRFALTRDWLGHEPPGRLEGEARERALAQLARRYLAGHAPADAEDLARWAGLPLREARAGLAAIEADAPGSAGRVLPEETAADVARFEGLELASFELAEEAGAPSRSAGPCGTLANR